jgi:hypothetical protein
MEYVEKKPCKYMYTENDQLPPHKKGGNLKLNDTDWQKRELKTLQLTTESNKMFFMI